MLCQNCKKEIDNNSKFCELCGYKTKKDKGYKEVIDKILNEKKDSEERVSPTLKQLNKKLWYRTLKVLYVIGLTAGLIIALGIAITDDEIMAFFILILLTFIILEILKRSFYYIYLGKIFPKRIAEDRPNQNIGMDKIWTKIQTQAFPGGHKQTNSEIDEVNDLLGKKYPKKKIMQAYLHIVFLFFIAEDTSAERIIQSTNIKMDSVIAKEDIVKIYNYVQNKFLRQFGIPD